MDNDRPFDPNETIVEHLQTHIEISPRQPHVVLFIGPELEAFAAIRADKKDHMGLAGTYLDVGLQMFNDCFVGIKWPVVIHG